MEVLIHRLIREFLTDTVKGIKTENQTFKKLQTAEVSPATFTLVIGGMVLAIILILKMS